MGILQSVKNVSSRFTKSDKRYHSEVRQEAVQQALAAMQGKNANKVPLPSKRSSVTRTTARDDEDEETGKVWYNVVYRASHLLANLGWVDFDLESSPGLLGQ